MFHFGANKTTVEVIKEGTFGGTYFREKNLFSWKILIKSIIVQVIMMLVLINMVLNVEQR